VLVATSTAWMPLALLLRDTLENPLRTLSARRARQCGIFGFELLLSRSAW